MTTTEAIQAVNAAAAGLGLEQTIRRRLFPQEAIAVVGRYHGARWSAVEDSFQNGGITAEQYADRIIGMIREFDTDRFTNRLKMTLEELDLDQRELA